MHVWTSQAVVGNLHLGVSANPAVQVADVSLEYRQPVVLVCETLTYFAIHARPTNQSLQDVPRKSAIALLSTKGMKMYLHPMAAQGNGQEWWLKAHNGT